MTKKLGSRLIEILPLVNIFWQVGHVAMWPQVQDFIPAGNCSKVSNAHVWLKPETFDLHGSTSRQTRVLMLDIEEFTNTLSTQRDEVAHEVLAQLDHELIVDALANLPQAQKEVILMAYF